MSYEWEYDDFLNETVIFEAFVSKDGYGSSTYNTANPKTAKVRIEQVRRIVRDANGKEVVSNTMIFVKPTFTDGSAVNIGISDRVTLPAGYTPAQPPIINVERHNDQDGLHHFEVLL